MILAVLQQDKLLGIRSKVEAFMLITPLWWVKSDIYSFVKVDSIYLYSKIVPLRRQMLATWLTFCRGHFEWNWKTFLLLMRIFTYNVCVDKTNLNIQNVFHGLSFKKRVLYFSLTHKLNPGLRNVIFLVIYLSNVRICSDMCKITTSSDYLRSC